MKSPILDGILWTAIRSMMTATDPNKAADYTMEIKKVAFNLDDKERMLAADDIRKNIEWNRDFPWEDVENLTRIWTGLAKWLAEGKRYAIEHEPPQTVVCTTWFTIIRHCIRYIIHRHTYAVSYADDIARYIPLMSNEQLSELDGYFLKHLRDDDDEPIRKLAAAVDLSNRYLVSAKATAGQIRQWVKDNNVAHLGGEYRDIEVTDIECFLFDGKYIGLEAYVNSPFAAGGVIPEFITQINKKPC